MRNIILIAPPAAGKGTQSKLISEKYNIPHISTGDLLRLEVSKQSILGEQIKNIMETGNLVGDDIVLKLLENRITEPDCNNGFILDGFPRNLNQANEYLNMLNRLNKPIGDVIYLNVPKETTRKRIVGRLYCPKCGAIYNDQFEDSKPKLFGTCDSCNNALAKRADDNDATFEERYKVYENETYPLIEFFTNKGCLYTIYSGISKERTFEEIEKLINRGNYD